MIQHPALQPVKQPPPLRSGADPIRRDRELRFRDYRLLPRARVLLRRDAAVDLGSRAFDLLHVLVSSQGSVVPRAELMKRVWPDTFVEESNLRFQMACLRKALGPDRELVKTVPGRGYFFVAEVQADHLALHDEHPRAYAQAPRPSALTLDELLDELGTIIGRLRSLAPDLQSERARLALGRR